MAAIAAVVGLCCCSSLSAAGGWFGGFISGTKPHFIKVTDAEKVKELYALAVEIHEKNKKELSKFPAKENELNEDERAEYTEIRAKQDAEVRDSDFCKKLKEFDMTAARKVRDDYQLDVTTLGGTKMKGDVFGEYIGSKETLEGERRQVDDLFKICLEEPEEEDEEL